MPKLESHLTRLGFTPEEVRLALIVEKTIFVFNRKVSIGEPQAGVTIETLKDELNKIDRMRYSDEQLTETLMKCIQHHILAERNGKYYSITYYGK